MRIEKEAAETVGLVRWMAPLFERPALGGAAVRLLSAVGGALLPRLARATRPGA